VPITGRKILEPLIIHNYRSEHFHNGSHYRIIFETNNFT
jgi:hypothetical protein